MSEREQHELAESEDPNGDTGGIAREFLCLVRRNDEGRLVYSPMNEPLRTLLTRLFLGSKLDEQSSTEIAAGFKSLHKRNWVHHSCDGRCGSGAGESVIWVGTRDDKKYYMQRHGGFTNDNAAQCIVVRHFENGSVVDFSLPEDPKDPGTADESSPGEESEADHQTTDEDQKGELPTEDDEIGTRRPNKPVPISEIATSIDDPDSMTFSAEPSADADHDGTGRGARYSGQRLLFSLATYAKLNRLAAAPTRDSQAQALRELGAGPPGDSINLRHFAFGDREILPALTARLLAAKETVPAGKWPVAYYVGAVFDVQHTGPSETAVVMHEGCTGSNLVVPIRIPKFARPTDLARAPYLLLLAATVDGDGGIRYLFGYAHPILSMSTWFLVDADGERDTLGLMLLELARLPIAVRQLVVIEKDLFPIRGVDGIPFLADFRVHVAQLLPSLLCFVETAGYRTSDYFRRKRGPHAVMRRNGPLIKHRTGRSPRELSDRVFRLSFRRILAKRLGALHQPSHASVRLPDTPRSGPAVRTEPSSLRVRTASEFGRLQSWVLARLRRRP